MAVTAAFLASSGVYAVLDKNRPPRAQNVKRNTGASKPHPEEVRDERGLGYIGQLVMMIHEVLLSQRLQRTVPRARPKAPPSKISVLCQIDVGGDLSPCNGRAGIQGC